MTVQRECRVAYLIKAVIWPLEILSKRPYKGILGVSTDIKAVESGGNQFVFRVDVDEYYPFPSRYIRYMAVRPLAQPPRKKRKIRPGTAPVEPLNGIIGVTLYGVS